jgi:mRNA interferase MazF
MASVNDLWLVDFGDPYPGEPAHYRPALIIGPPDTFGANFPFVIVCPLTTKFRGLSIHVEVDPSSQNGLDERSYVQSELLRSINRRRLVHRLGALEAIACQHVETVVRTLLNH